MRFSVLIAGILTMSLANADIDIYLPIKNSDRPAVLAALENVGIDTSQVREIYYYGSHLASGDYHTDNYIVVELEPRKNAFDEITQTKVQCRMPENGISKCSYVDIVKESGN